MFAIAVSAHANERNRNQKVERTSAPLVEVVKQWQSLKKCVYLICLHLLLH